VAPHLRDVSRRKQYKSIGDLQADLDAWIDRYNADRRNLGRYWNFDKGARGSGKSAVRGKQKVSGRQSNVTRCTLGRTQRA
jgi:hypothetical protein